ncbi:OmpA family protein [Psychromonas sp. Urea-02u-13]|uniref:OmpA family protein n=1 Tax=Psychromonas sp. Urea-02u-13 TaxID=2058326 RepID=UPI000C3260BD|nr:OmpA family protein [Psychromonas sp. Urea-02u-13]PKG37917.1 OmpA family protein [Psychromonas sp. Urea-02u-13]
MRLITAPITALILSTSLLFLAGCTNSAPKGYGGVAEHQYSEMPDHPVGLENALYFELQMTRRHLESLILSGAKICFPASVRLSQIREARIARELQGGLDGDAANDLIIQRDQLERLQRRLNYIQQQESCLPHRAKPLEDKAENTEQALSANKIKEIMLLLNNNNQFVTDSAELNPRYIGQLAEVCILLRPYTQYHLKLTGHTDTKGTDSYNLKLSMQRAAQVERYLQIFGLDPNNIEIDGSGSLAPLFVGNEAQTRLVNRRVSIELITVNPASGVMTQ